MNSVEVNFDGLAGPTHNFAGLAIGNLASRENRYRISHPRQAALEGLKKMRLLLSLGIPQGLILPQERPNIPALHRLGYRGTDQQILEKAARKNLEDLLLCSSSSAMWTANAATVSPSADTADRKVHFTPANLISQAHRRLETEMTARLLKIIFPDEKYFVHHPPLADAFGDEGAANHMRFCAEYGGPGLNAFAYGRKEGLGEKQLPSRFLARQNFETSRQVIRAHSLDEKKTLCLQQNPAAIDGGAFHNDVVAVNNQTVLLVHEQAFVKAEEGLRELTRAAAAIFSSPLMMTIVSPAELALEEAVKCYLFNSQIVSSSGGEMALIAPSECADNKKARKVVDRLLAGGGPVRRVEFVKLYESMRNGGGPACLRLRVVLNEKELSAVHSGFLMNEKKLTALEKWVGRHYRENLNIDDLADPNLLKESRQALDELTQMVGCGPVYSFQNG